MSRAWTAFRTLLAVQALLAAVAATLEWTLSCAACRTGGLSLGLLGFAFYTGLSVAAAFSGPGRFVFGAALFSFGVHVILVAQLLSAGLRCWVCFGAGAASLALAVLSIACDRANVARLAFVLPWALLLVVTGGRLSPPPATAAALVTDTASVRMTVFTQPDCPYCDELRDRVLPPIESEFGPRLRVVYRPSTDLPAIQRTPTIVLAPGRRNATSRVIEGLPSAEMLRDAVLEMENRP